MTIERACSNCAYCGEVDYIDRIKSQFPTKKPVCRRNPPQAVVNGAGVAQALWPMVQPDDWCGEWMSKDLPTTKDLQITAGKPKPPKAVKPAA